MNEYTVTRASEISNGNTRIDRINADTFVFEEYGVLAFYTKTGKLVAAYQTWIKVVQSS